MAHNRSRLTMLAGWLFADLFLVLLIIGLAALPGRPAVHSRGTSSPTPTPSPTHSLGLDPHYLKFSITLTPDAFRAGSGGQLVNEVNSAMRRLDPTGRLVGFVLVFASDVQANASRAVATATNAFKLLHARSAAFASSTGLGYWNGEHNDFEFKVFLLN
jgi:hypothetical protein